MALLRVQGVINTDTISVADPNLRATVLGAACQVGDLIVACWATDAEITGAFEPSYPLGYDQDSIRATTIQAALRSAGVCHATALGGETAIVLPWITDASHFAAIAVDVYRGNRPAWNALAALPTLTAGADAPLPGVTPAADLAAVVFGFAALEPNYNPAMPAGWTQRNYLNGGWNRETFKTLDQLIDPTTGATIGGVLTGSGPETMYSLHEVAYINVAAGSGSFAGEPGGGLW